MSRVDQDPSLQFDALRRGGIDDVHLVVEHASGSKEDRLKLAALLAELSRGDVLTVSKLDRLGRSLVHLVTTLDDLGGRGIELVCCDDG